MKSRGLFLIAALLIGLSGCDVEVDKPVKAIEPIVPEVAPPEVGDLQRGAELAKQCQDCHGLDGVRAASGAPFIAGLEQDYLVRSLLSYRDGTRNHKAMMKVSKELDALQLADVTAYYASLDTRWHGAVADERSRAVLKDRRARGEAEHIVKACKSCHRNSGRQQGEVVVPNLDGTPLEYFIPAFESYASGARQNEIMVLFKNKLNDAEIYNLGAYYAARVPKKPASTEVGNPAKGKIAARGCAGCHGFDGAGLNPHIPNLAGQPAGYLIKAIRDYRDGRRHGLLMQTEVEMLTDRTINDLAAYYSRQQPRSQLHQDIESAAAFNPLGDGEQIATSCNSCHGADGNSEKAGIPSLSGQSVKYIVKASQDYQQGLRSHPAMQKIVSFFSDTDLEKAAYFYATRQPAPVKKKSVGDVAAGEALSEACVSCHGDKGVSLDPVKTPSLAGQDAAYLMRATQAYAKGERHHDAMAGVARKLEPQQLKDLAAYFAAQTPRAVETFLPDDPAYLVSQRCSRCHGERGYSTKPGVPRLAGQLERYGIYAMKEYQQGIRKDQFMEPMADVLSLLEIKAIAAYYARQ